MTGVQQTAGAAEPRRAARSRPGRRTGRSDTRQAILAAARARFAEYGYDGATIRAIAGDAGVDPALVHHFYRDKERLFAAAMRLPVVPSEILRAALAPGARDPRVGLGEHLVRTALAAWETAGVLPTLLGLLRSALTSERAAAMLREFLTETILGPVAEIAIAAGPGAEMTSGAGEGTGVVQTLGVEQSARVGHGLGAGRGADAGQASRAVEIPDAGQSAGAGQTPGIGAVNPGAAGTFGAEYRAAMVASQMVGLAVTRYVLALGPVAEPSPDDLAATIGPTLDRYLTGVLPSAPSSRARPRPPTTSTRP